MGAVANLKEKVLPTHLEATMKSGTIEFDAYHLKKTFTKSPAREGGLKGALIRIPVAGRVFAVMSWKVPAATLGLST